MVAQPHSGLRESYGSVRGKLLSVGTRGAPVAVVEDHLTRRPIVCFLRERDLAGLPDDAIGRDVMIAGTVSREPDGGALVSVHAVRTVTVLPRPELFAFRRARGVLRRPADGLLPEEAIRRMRDES